MNIIKAIEGDYIETKEDNLIFDVKGLSHPKNKIISFIRFYPSPLGNRERNGIIYKKIYDLQERFTFLKNNYPKYLFYSKQCNMNLQGVDNKNILKVYSPREYYNKLLKHKNSNNKDIHAFNLCNFFIQNSNLPEDSIGITGSQMVGLNRNNSDIDLIIYGTENSYNFQKDLVNIFNESRNTCRKYNNEELKSHFNFRAKGSDIVFKDFLQYEKRKLHQGKYNNIDFFIRYIKSPEDWNDNYYDYKYEDFNMIKLKARIIDSKNSIFTPCKYKIKVNKIIDNPLKVEFNKIREIVSFRGRFCEQAIDGETVMVEGKLEKVIKKKEDPYYRIILGNNKRDKMLLI
ncbi:MAG: hypothetical protein JXA99_11055 [Candidatus Lokiarchaeota archaeon]|nr:hypothetical protein [Candidatus Lokiarchaeota archaeon]